ncbi:hypothetical protein OIV83_004559 [Microbotryomycetes sp. JL201]|nr:hypothetical protein OIV83_004559 [Microbotryomycetes sp. JL201]
MDDQQSSMLGDTSSGQNVNNEGPESSFSTSDSSSDKFSSEGASFTTSGGQSGSASLGSSGQYSSAQYGQGGGSDEEFGHRQQSEGGSGERFGDEQSRKVGGGGREMDDQSASMSGEQSSEPNVNNEFSSSTGDSSFNAERGSASSLGGRGGNNDDRVGQFDGGGSYEGAKGYGAAPVERDQQTGDFA